MVYTVALYVFTIFPGLARLFAESVWCLADGNLDLELAEGAVLIRQQEVSLLYWISCYYRYILSLRYRFVILFQILTWSMHFTSLQLFFFFSISVNTFQSWLESQFQGFKATFATGILVSKDPHPFSHLSCSQPYLYSRESQANGTTFKFFSIYRSHHILQRLVWNYQPTLTHQFLDLWLWGWSKSLLTTPPWYSCPRRRESWKAIVTTRSIWGRVSANPSFKWWKDGLMSSRRFLTKGHMFLTNLQGKWRRTTFQRDPWNATISACC